MLSWIHIGDGCVTFVIF